MSQDRPDLTRPPDLSRDRRTGPLRTQRPIYVDLLPPCNHACPAGESIQAWLGSAQGGRFEEAWQMLVADNPLPAVHGRVCYHPCQGSCNRRQLDTAVSIHAVERFLGDAAIEQGWRHERRREPTGKRILVVGGGPSGLPAAHHVARLGHPVEIRDAGPMPGGMMHFRIPAYRMPRAVLEAEIRTIEDLGIKITTVHKVEDVEADKKEGRFDACFFAVGAHLSKRTEIPARNAGRMLDAVSFVRDVGSTKRPSSVGSPSTAAATPQCMRRG
jgi:formate dehydrogenase (NADP+) beta subunit